jgi:hypothetical protein
MGGSTTDSVVGEAEVGESLGESSATVDDAEAGITVGGGVVAGGRRQLRGRGVCSMSSGDRLT